MTEKKYNIMTTIEDDAPFGDINFFNISFLSSEKIEKTKWMNIKGFKIHNGYNSGEMADSDCEEIRRTRPNHDVFVGKVGKLHPWDDATKTDTTKYDNKKLNDLEKARKENVDKINLMSEQMKNEFKYKTIKPNSAIDRMDRERKRINQKLYKMGKISKKESEMLEQEELIAKKSKAEPKNMIEINREIEECFKTDFLDENPPVALKYGIITVYFPKYIKNLKSIHIKIRGLFQSMTEMNKRVRQLEKLYPKDRIYKFEIGKWCALSDDENLSELEKNKQLNYLMKCYLNNLEHEAEDFEKRKEELTEKNKQEQKVKKIQNRRERRKAKKEAEKKSKEKSTEFVSNDTDISNNKKIDSEIESKQNTPFFENKEDEEAIQKIVNFLEDPELANKYSVDKSKLQTMQVDI